MVSFNVIANVAVKAPGGVAERAEQRVVSMLIADGDAVEAVHETIGVCPKLLGAVAAAAVERTLCHPSQASHMKTLVSEANKFHGGQTSTTANKAFKKIAGHVVTNMMNNPLMQTFCGIGGFAESVHMQVIDIFNFYSPTHCSLISAFICMQRSSLLYQCSSLLCLAPSLLRARMEQLCFLPHFKRPLT